MSRYIVTLKEPIMDADLLPVQAFAAEQYTGADAINPRTMHFTTRGKTIVVNIHNVLGIVENGAFAGNENQEAKS